MNINTEYIKLLVQETIDFHFISVYTDKNYKIHVYMYI